MSSPSAKNSWYYELRPRRIKGLKLLGLLPGHYRSKLAERFLRRPDQPGPAPEHVLQYLVSATLSERRTATEDESSSTSESEMPSRPRSAKPVTVGQADFFYRSQYRQFCSPVMGAFAATAPQVLAAAGTRPRGWLWGRRRQSVSAVMPSDVLDEFRPVLVIDRGTVALAVFLPQPTDETETQAIDDWVKRRGPVPPRFQDLIAGLARPGDPGVADTRERSHFGSTCELVDAAISTGSLALLALHPYDPDAMGLHLTLFGVEATGPEQLIKDYGLAPEEIANHLATATQQNATLHYLVGETAEVFTQCSQNLFAKQPATNSDRQSPSPAKPALSLESLLSLQFETLQATIAADGVPGASPRNGQIGRAAYLGHYRGHAQVLIPYHPGNAIHGHAAKLWTNQHGSIVVSDDHSSLRRVTVSGPATFLSHEKAAKRFPEIARAVTHPEGGDEQSVADPVYWFVTQADRVMWETGLLARNELTAQRPVCGINAGGEGHHTKKPKYFDATAVDEYDVHLQHEREASPRPVDPTGATHAEWLVEIDPALASREAHLAKI